MHVDFSTPDPVTEDWTDDLDAEQIRQLHEDGAHADALDALEAFGIVMPDNATKDDAKKLLRHAAYQLIDIAERLDLARRH